MVDLEIANKQGKYTFEEFVEIIRLLRAPGGCPWDREQTHKSIRNDFLEEAYEAADAIDTSDDAALCEELGDVLLQVTLHSQIADEEGSFNISDVIDTVARKMILRHPHVFGEVKVENSAEVLSNWDKIKMAEKSQKTATDTLLSVPRAFPALMRAGKVQKRASKVGFDWSEVEGPLSKVEEETAELKSAIAKGNAEETFEEFGDLLFAAVNVSRFIGVNAEEALSFATDKFINRFARVEELAVKRGIDMKTASLETLDKLWDEVKTVFKR
ncbi:MAG: nucleoside triphosphate pyrophosphohydrolase [Clostridia bacterium]|nr:nucleoside triphosphate pyrophosphohydrolase [Clostridia bacterium]